MKPAQIASVIALVALAALVTFLAVRGRQPPILPADTDHTRFISSGACLSCHGPQGGSPQPKTHPLGNDCMRCHGMGVKSSGLYPDLRFATRATLEKWDDIVLGGIRAGGGMASFADVLTPAQSREVQAYVATRALHEPNVAQRALGFLAENICVPATWFAD